VADRARRQARRQRGRPADRRALRRAGGTQAAAPAEAAAGIPAQLLPQDVRLRVGPGGHPAGPVRGPGLRARPGAGRIPPVAVAGSDRGELSVFAPATKAVRGTMPQTKPLSRRTFLRGAGVALGLPLLEAMLPRTGSSLGAAEQAAGAPVRAAYLYFPNGAWMDAWVPKQTGADYELPFSLTPLAPVRDAVVVLSGLDKPFSRSGDGHYAKTANFLTGLHVHKTTGQDLNSGGISVDQVAAERFGHLTPLPSLELATDPVINGLDRAVNYTRMYGSYISWRKPNLPMPRIIDPRAAFERMFGPRDAAGKPLPQPSRAEDKNLLDAALDDARDLRPRLRSGAPPKLDHELHAA